MKKSIFFMAVIATIITTSCTQNQMAKQYGGVMEVNLPSNQKLINVTWKDGQLWYLTRQMKQDDTAETYQFKEKSGFGIVEGTVLLRESK